MPVISMTKSDVKSGGNLLISTIDVAASYYLNKTEARKYLLDVYASHKTECEKILTRLLYESIPHLISLPHKKRLAGVKISAAILYMLSVREPRQALSTKIEMWTPDIASFFATLSSPDSVRAVEIQNFAKERAVNSPMGYLASVLLWTLMHIKLQTSPNPPTGEEGNVKYIEENTKYLFAATILSSIILPQGTIEPQEGQRLLSSYAKLPRAHSISDLDEKWMETYARYPESVLPAACASTTALYAGVDLDLMIDTSTFRKKDWMCLAAGIHAGVLEREIASGDKAKAKMSMTEAACYAGRIALLSNRYAEEARQAIKMELLLEKAQNKGGPSCEETDNIQIEDVSQQSSEQQLREQLAQIRISLKNAKAKNDALAKKNEALKRERDELLSQISTLEKEHTEKQCVNQSITTSSNEEPVPHIDFHTKLAQLLHMYRCVIVGGNPNQMKKFAEAQPDAVLIGEDKVGTCGDVLQNADVIMCKYNSVGHKLSTKAKQIADSKNIPFVYLCGNTSIEMLERDMYEKLAALQNIRKEELT